MNVNKVRKEENGARLSMLVQKGRELNEGARKLRKAE